jgi:hypothetical protein
LYSFEDVTSRQTWVQVRGMKDSNPFTQQLVQQATDIWLLSGQDLFRSHKTKTHVLYAVCIQNINYRLTLLTAHYHIILISQYCNFMLDFLYILEFFHFKHTNMVNLIPRLMRWSFIPLFSKTPGVPPPAGDLAPRICQALLLII